MMNISVRVIIMHQARFSFVFHKTEVFFSQHFIAVYGMALMWWPGDWQQVSQSWTCRVIQGDRGGGDSAPAPPDGAQTWHCSPSAGQIQGQSGSALTPPMKASEEVTPFPIPPHCSPCLGIKTWPPGALDNQPQHDTWRHTPPDTIHNQGEQDGRG